MASKLLYSSALVTGILLLLTGLLHLLNINDTIVAVKTGDIAASQEANIIIIWIFAGLAMMLLGVWCLFLARGLKMLWRKAWWQALLLGMSLSGFGIGSWLQYPESFHVLFFLVLGLLLLLPLLIYSGKCNQKA